MNKGGLCLFGEDFFFISRYRDVRVCAHVYTELLRGDGEGTQRA